MNFVGGLAHSIAGAPLMQRLLGTLPAGLTCLLYHGFFFPGDSKDGARERLRRQLHWLRTDYNPLTLDEYHHAVGAGTLPPRALLVTADDAKVDLMEVRDEFKAFGVPLTVYVCAGWTAQASEIEKDGLLARVVTTLAWYAGPDVMLSVGGEARGVRVGASCRDETVDQILSSRDYYEPHLEELLAGIQAAAGAARKSTICTWPELVSLRESGFQFGSHSVSHIRLAPASDVRLRFEIVEAKRLIDSKLGRCVSFAYPYGTPGTSDLRTTAELRAAGMKTAFMTHPGFGLDGDSVFHLPRFALPERHMTDAEYRGRVRGGGITLFRVKNALRRKQVSR